MLILAFFLLAALAYSIAERSTRDLQRNRVGGITFVRCGRLTISYSVRRA